MRDRTTDGRLGRSRRHRRLLGGDTPGSLIRYRESIVTEVSAADAFELLGDMATLDTWNPNVSASQRISGERLEVGSEYRSTISRGPMRMRATSRLVESAPGRRVLYESTISGMHSIDGIDFEQTEGGTIVTFFNESRPPAWLRPLAPLLGAAFRPQARRAVAGARAALQGLER